MRIGGGGYEMAEEGLKPPYILGIDSGTSACKAALFTLEGRIVAETSVDHTIHHPKPDYAEQDPAEWWNSAVKAISSLVKRSGVKPGDIVGLSVDSQREAVVFLDRGGESLARSIIWLDRRAIPQAEAISKIIDPERILEITGLPLDFIFSAPKILWVKENTPEIYGRTWRILCAKDYIVYRLTGIPVTDYTMASRTMLFDIRKLRWSEELCEALGIDPSILPEARGSWEVAGEVTAKAAEDTGLKPGTPVACGGGDRPCEALGAGVVDEGMANIGTGTGSVFEIPLEEPRLDKGMRFDCCLHVAPSRWEYEGIVNATGASLRWFRDNFCRAEAVEAEVRGLSIYHILDVEASRVPVGCEGVYYYPHLWGARLPKPNPRAKGVFYGILHSHGRGHFVRAILEAAGFQYLGTLRILKELGVSIERIRMVGGESKSRVWNRIKSDIIGLRIEIPKIRDAAALGSAILGGVAAGVYRDPRSAALEIVEVDEVYDPDPSVHRVYAEIYEDYIRVYSRLEESFT
jgi:xylulokinase